MAKKREEYSEQLKWNVKDLYASEKEYKKDFEEVESRLKKLALFKGHIMESAKKLLALLELDTEVDKKIEQIYVYAHLQNDQDTTNVKYQVLYKKAYKLYESYRETTSFIVPEILKSTEEVVEKFLKEEKGLKSYERMLKDLFKMKPFILDESREQLISQFSGVMGVPDEVFSYLTDADLKFGTILNEKGEEEELTEKSYRKFIESPNREVRKNAFLKLFTTYGDFKNTYAALLASEVAKNNKIALIRGYKSTLHSSLFGNDIPESVYFNLIATVKKNIAPLSKFWKIKKKNLGVEELHLYDTFASGIKIPTKTYSENDAKQVILDSLNVLGENYIKDLTQAFDEGWIDYPPNDGKRNGAYCTACYNVHPYVLLSFDGTLNNVSTLAHELGHAMHYYYAIKNQSYQDYGYSIFVAEVASQVNQILLSKHLIEKSTSKEEKMYLIDDLISDFKSTIYRQTMFADFELQIHEKEQKGEVLTHELLSDLYYKLNQEYFGENITIDDEIRYEWERIPHFYMKFYVYQYATAYAAAIKIAMDILNQKENACEHYLEFLGLGCTKTPIESLKVAGVDMTREETLQEAFTYFEDLVRELKELSEE